MLVDKDSYKLIQISFLFVGPSSNLLGYPSLTDQPWLALTSKTPSRQMRLYSAWQPLAKAWSSFSSPPSISCNRAHRMASAFRVTNSTNSKIDPEKTDRLKSRKLGRSWFYTVDLLELATSRRYLNSWPSMLFKSPKSGIPELIMWLCLKIG